MYGLEVRIIINNNSARNPQSTQLYSVVIFILRIQVSWILFDFSFYHGNSLRRHLGQMA